MKSNVYTVKSETLTRANNTKRSYKYVFIERNRTLWKKSQALLSTI